MTCIHIHYKQVHTGNLISPIAMIDSGQQYIECKEGMQGTNSATYRIQVQEFTVLPGQNSKTSHCSGKCEHIVIGKREPFPKSNKHFYKVSGNVRCHALQMHPILGC